MKRKIIFRNVLFAVLIVSIAVAIYGYSEFNRKSESILNKTADININESDIINAFTTDEQVATAKYGGKIILVNGIVKKIDKDELGNYTVVIGNNSSLSSVRCSMDSLFTNDLINIKLNTSVLVKGICTGFNADEMGLGSDVILNRCIVVKK